MINEFRGKYYFLSNFYSSPVTYEGLTYLNNEAAFQSAKTFSNRECFTNLDPSSAKKLGRRVQLRSDWEETKYNIMYEIVKALIDTGFDGCIRPDHGRMIWDEQARPGYGLYDRALGVAYLNGLWEAIHKNK